MFIVGLLVQIGTVTVSASEYEFKQNSNISSYIMSLDGPTVYYYDVEKGKLTTKNAANRLFNDIDATAISCVLSGNTAGIPELYGVYIRWYGNNLVEKISADNLTIKNSNWLSPDVYYSKGFNISGLSSKNGYRSVGACYIPKSVNSVYMKTTRLGAYFYDKDYWIKLGEISGTYYMKK